jgi:hypothetical protein
MGAAVTSLFCFIYSRPDGKKQKPVEDFAFRQQAWFLHREKQSPKRAFYPLVG